MKKLICKKSIHNFLVGCEYDYYSNFGGLNHFVIEGELTADSVRVFDGPYDNHTTKISRLTVRYWLYDYFMTPWEWRELQIESILNE